MEFATSLLRFVFRFLVECEVFEEVLDSHEILFLIYVG